MFAADIAEAKRQSLEAAEEDGMAVAIRASLGLDSASAEAQRATDMPSSQHVQTRSRGVKEGGRECLVVQLTRCLMLSVCLMPVR